MPPTTVAVTGGPKNVRGVVLKTPIPGPKGKAVVDLDTQYLMTSTKTAPVVAQSAKGVWVTDVDGNRILDFTSGVGVLGTGHCHPAVVEAVQNQAKELMHFAGTDFYYEIQARLAEKLAKLAPGKNPKKVFFTNSGTESVEAAVKMARWNTQRPLTLGLIGSFHGRSMGALTLTSSKPAQRRRFNAYTGGGVHIPAPTCYRCPYKLEYPSCDLYCAKILEELYFNTVLPPEDIAAFVAEPVIGEGGYVVPPKEYFQVMQRMLKPHGILHVSDEVQAGMGRTGKWWAIENFGVVPDMITTAKALGSGMPIGAMVFDAKLDYTYQGAHSNTYGGNAVGCAASLATFDVFEREHLLDNATKQGAYLTKRLKELQGKYDCIGDVRGLGLMVATDFVKDRTTREHAPKLRDEVEKQAYQRGLVLLGCGRSAIRFIPALIVKEPEIDEAVEIYEQAVGAALKATGAN
ncbi:MAG: acetyl ornithine aminotransferase family protein [Euryarchaeota archaeon]|nr:acetyl ornithine aminotransferase family protein [Euryarchaeota archaeon]MDE1835781.1 acetyl ornithine aminotransferase family protein [Euryarchaeota archaeon]MDE2043972.1 acetyl ornithine aminotransferase family protein [Thermoplasmata archaeon]